MSFRLLIESVLKDDEETLLGIYALVDAYVPDAEYKRKLAESMAVLLDRREATVEAVLSLVDGAEATLEAIDRDRKIDTAAFNRVARWVNLRNAVLAEILAAVAEEKAKLS